MRPSRYMLALTVVFAALSIIAVILAPDNGEWLLLPCGALLLIVLADVLLSVAPRGISVAATLPPRGFVGHKVPLSLVFTGRRLPRQIDLRAVRHDGVSSDTLAPVSLPPSATEARLNLEIPLQERGEIRLTQLAMRYMSRLKMFEILPAWPLNLVVTAAPDISPVLNGDIQAQMLPLLDGARASKIRGEGSEFHQLRDFAPGMDPRTIDWKRSARANALVSRETRVERNHQIIICLDTGHLMGERLAGLAKLDHAIHAALALCWASGLAGDNVGFYSFGPRPQPFIPPGPGRKAFGRIQTACATLEQSSSETNHTLGLSVLNAKLRRRSLIVVFSDFTDSVSAELLVENLAVMQRQHLILYVTLRDPEVQSLTRPDSSGMNDIARAIAASRILQEREVVLDRLRRLGVLCLDSAPGGLTGALLSRYIEIKAKEMI